MALPRIGGETPIIKYGTEINVEAPTGTNATTPVVAGRVYKLGGTAADGSGAKLAVCADNDSATTVVLCMALITVNDINVPVSVKILGARGMNQIRRLPYVSGAAPTIGQSIAANAATGKIKGKAFAPGDGYVLFVDTAALDAEVLV